LASGDEELIREIWVHTPDEVRTQRIGAWLRAAAEFQLEVPFRWLLGMASDANLDLAVEQMVEYRLVGALCEVEATGFDLRRMRPARALSRWSRTTSLAVIPMPSLPSVSPSTLLAWHIRTLRSWNVSCDEPKALASGRVDWADPAPRIDLASMTTTPAKRVLFLAQAVGGVVVGAFANCPLSRDVRGRDPALRSAVFVLEHPAGEQRKWQLQDADYEVTVSREDLSFGAGFGVDVFGYLDIGSAREFDMTEVDASFICLRLADKHGWCYTQIICWELLSV
jgi:hypothetical protein